MHNRHRVGNIARECTIAENKFRTIVSMNYKLFRLIICTS